MKMKKLTGILMAGMLMASMAGCGAVSVDGETKTRLRLLRTEKEPAEAEPSGLQCPR